MDPSEQLKYNVIEGKDYVKPNVEVKYVLNKNGKNGKNGGKKQKKEETENSGRRQMKITKFFPGQEKVTIKS